MDLEIIGNPRVTDDGRSVLQVRFQDTVFTAYHY